MGCSNRSTDMPSGKVRRTRLLWLAPLAVATGLVGCQQPAAPQPYRPNWPRVNLAPGYKLDPSWPADPPPAPWGAMPAVTIDRQGRVWTLNRAEIPVQVYSPDGRLLGAWGEGLGDGVHGLEIDHDGNVWIADATLHVVRKFTPDGEPLLTLGIPGEPGDDGKHLNRPTDLAITPAGDVFVSDGYSNNRIVHFDAQGRFVKSWGIMGIRLGELSLPHAIAVDSKGRLYVAERNNGRIQVFDQDGISIALWPSLIIPWGICITPDDEVFVCGSSPMHWTDHPLLGIPPKDQIIMKFDTTGRVLELWTFPKGEDGKERPGELNWLHGIAVDPQGNLYLGDVHGNRAQKFTRMIEDGEGG